MAGAFKKAFLGLMAFVKQVVQGTHNYDFSASGGSGTTVTVDVTSGLLHNNNIATAADDFFNKAQIYFLPSTATAALQGKVYNVSDFAVSGSTATFTTAETMPATPASGELFWVYTPMQKSNVTINEKTDNLPTDHVRKTLVKPPSNKGKTSADGSFDVQIWGLETTLGNGATPALDRCSQLLSSCCSRRVEAGTTVSGSGSTTTVVDVTDASNFQVGDHVMINGEVGRITAVDTVSTPDNITLGQALSAAPAASDVVYFGERNSMLDTGHEALTLLFLEDDMLHVLNGAILTLKAAGTWNQNLMFSFDFSAEGYDQVDTTTIEGSQSSKRTIPFITGAAFFGASAININSFEFAFGGAIEYLEDTGAGNRPFWSGADPSCSVTLRNESVTLKETWEANGTEAHLLIQVGNTPGDCITFAGRCQIQESASRQTVAGHSFYSAPFGFVDPHTDPENSYRPEVIRF